MARNFNKYQYETSPRKIEPDYTTFKRNEPQRKKSTARKPETNKKKLSKKQEKELKAKQIKMIRNLIVAFLIFFGICFRNAQIDESFEKVQDLKEELQIVEKENSQLEIAIENSVNINNIEQQAKELLGMQKLTNKQTVYVELEKNDYIAATEDVIIEEESILDKIIGTINSLFK